jgi:nucleotide-binding universal stress UspA family protein
MFGMASSQDGWHDEWRQWADRVRQRLSVDWCQPLRRAAVAFRPVVILGGVGELLSYIRDEHADLLVVGRRGLGGFRELVVGSFSQQLIHHSPIPVLVVPRSEQPASTRVRTSAATSAA